MNVSAGRGNKTVPKMVLYIVGLVPVAFGQRWLREFAGDILGVLVVIAYLVALRFLIEYFSAKRKKTDPDHVGDA